MVALGVEKFGKLGLVLSAYTTNLDYLEDFLVEQLMTGTCSNALVKYCMHVVCRVGHPGLQRCCGGHYVRCYNMLTVERVTALPMSMLHGYQQGCYMATLS